MGRYERHTENENRPEAADKKRLVDPNTTSLNQITVNLAKAEALFAEIVLLLQRNSPE